MQANIELEGNIINVEDQTISFGKVVISNGVIASIIPGKPATTTSKGSFIMPGLIDAHIHIEDTLLSVCEFARLAVSCGTVASVCDPHEIANVVGIAGVRYMIDQGKRTPYKFFNGAPSCVPATEFETSGARLGPEEIRTLMNDKDITHLSEFMRFPEIAARNPYDMEKIEIAKKTGKPIDGHAPMLVGPELDKYISAGITTEHECSLLEEAREKAKKGMKIIVREGSAAHNLQTLYPIIDEMPEQVMLCTDDCHADDLVYNGYMNYIVKMAISLGCSFFNVLRAATVNAVKHYKLPVGLLRVGDPADLIVVDSLKEFNVLQTYIDGKLVYNIPEILISPLEQPIINNFNIDPITDADIALPAVSFNAHTIEVIDKELITKDIICPITVNSNNEAIANPSEDILKIVVVNRYYKAKPAVGFIKGYGLQSGALAFSISHDSHNIVSVGTNDGDIVKAVNLIIKHKGGASLSDKDKQMILPLPIGGLMSTLGAKEVAEKYKELQNKAKDMGCRLTSPFPTLSFMCLTVIPYLKISDKGLFDVNAKKPISVFEKN